jgi:5-methyltetrahydrofolate--homocysteine methyltransferase
LIPQAGIGPRKDPAPGKSPCRSKIAAEENNMEPILQEIFDGILNGESKTVEAKVKAALERKMNPKEILDQGMVSAMAEVGRRFEQGEYFVPEMLISARAMQSGMAVLKPYLKEANIATSGRVAIGTVKGDLHDIGKNLVAMMLEGAGFEIMDMGTDVDPEKFAAAADQVDVIALSALLTTTMPNMKTTIEALQRSGKRAKVKVVIGGAPVTEAYAQQIGADGYAPDASRAVTVTKALLAK